jgi:hypothetical protein
MNIYLRHPRHGTKVAISQQEARDDMEWGWEEYDPNDPDEMETPTSSEEEASGVSANALRPKRGRKPRDSMT